MTEQEAFLQAAKEAWARGDEELAWATHRAFSDWLEEHGFDDEAQVQRRWTPDRQHAEDRLRDLAQICGFNYYDWDEEGNESGEEITYEQMIQTGYNYLERGDYFTQIGSETARDVVQGEVAEQFWKDWSTVTGVDLPATDKHDWPKDRPWDNPSPFSCSC
jgi:hypothetical protein